MRFTCEKPSAYGVSLHQDDEDVDIYLERPDGQKRLVAWFNESGLNIVDQEVRPLTAYDIEDMFE